jgi:predicted transcriptional regulator
VSNNRVAANEVGELVQKVHEALRALGAAPSEEKPKLTPVVSPRAAIKPDELTCLVCGQKARMLKRHLGSAHEMTPEDYRREFGLKPDYPMVAPNYSAERRSLAHRMGLGRKPVASTTEKTGAPAAKPARSRRASAKPRGSRA